jgi:hypothetical protein
MYIISLLLQGLSSSYGSRLACTMLQLLAADLPSAPHNVFALTYYAACLCLFVLAVQSQGALSIALQPGAKPFLPFESWQYSLPRYRQYMAELAAVHMALEQALTLALAAPPAAAASDSSGSLSSISIDETSLQGAAAAAAASSSSAEAAANRQQQQQGWAVVGRSAAAMAAYTALSCFSAESGLWRAHAAQADLAALAELAAARHSDKQQQQQQQQQGKRKSDELHASQNAVAYGKYLLQLGRAAAAGTAAAAAAAAIDTHAAHTAGSKTTNSSSSSSSSSSLLLEEDEGTAAALKLLAHAYALHVQQQCLGTRIGAAATDHLELMTTGLPTTATATYMQYPQHVEEPLQQLVAVTDAAGRLLDVAGRQAVLDELPKALKKATLMLAPLATA